MDDQIFIQHRFTITDPDTGYSFTDALVMPQGEYEALQEDDIESQKQERFDNWKEAIATPPAEESDEEVVEEE